MFDILDDLEAERKRAIGVFGNKGGIGKSLCFNALYSAMLSYNYRNISIINADLANQDVNRLCKRASVSLPNVDLYCLDVDLADPEDIAAKSDSILAAPCDPILINTPGALSIAKSDEMLSDLARIVDLEYHAFWPMTADEDSQRGILSSIERGMLSRSKTLTIVINDRAGKKDHVESIQRFIDDNLDEAREQFEDFKVIRVNRLDESVASAYRINNASFFEMLQPNAALLPSQIYRSHVAGLIKVFRDRLDELHLIGRQGGEA